MKLIAHRGNTNGPSEEENSPEHIEKAIDNSFDVEVDIWINEDGIWLGHDRPEYSIEYEFLEKYKDSLWCHAKNIEAILFLSEKHLHCFYINDDHATITSKGFLWLSPSNKEYVPGFICVMPEDERWNKTDSWLNGCIGICSDNIMKFKTE